MTDRALDENEVSVAVEAWLREQGYRARSLTAGQHGIDVAGWHPETGHRWAIEAKGATSSKKWTSGFGAPISEGAAYQGVSKALLNAVAWTGLPAFADTSIGVAFPNDRFFRMWVAAIEPACQLLGIAIFMVDDDGVYGYPQRAGAPLVRPASLAVPTRRLSRSMRRNMKDLPPYPLEPD